MQKQEIKKSKGKKISRIILIIIAVLGIVLGIIQIREALRYETTDDAQLDTDISPISARVQGYITKVNFTDNQHVKKGDTLVLLDDRDYKIKLEQAEAALQNAIASLEVAKANANAVHEGGGTQIFKIDELKIRLEKASRDFERYKKLMMSSATTEQQIEKAQTEKETLEKQLQAAQQQQIESNSKTNTAKEQIRVSESVVSQRKSDVDFAKLQLSYTIITAQIDGIVSKKNVVSGQLIQAGQALCAIMAEQNIWVVANFKETQFNKMKPGMKVNVEVDAFPGKLVTGKISSFASATGSKFSLIPPDNATGNFVKVVQRVPVKIDLDTTIEVFKELKPGMSVNVKVLLEEK